MSLPVNSDTETAPRRMAKRALITGELRDPISLKDEEGVKRLWQIIHRAPVPGPNPIFEIILEEVPGEFDHNQTDGINFVALDE